MSTLMKELHWPERMPILKDRDIIKFQLHSLDGSRHDLVGWIYTYVPDQHTRIVLIEEMRKRMAKFCRLPVNRVAIADFNDLYDTECSARVWNETMKVLGYKSDGTFWRK